MNSQQLLEDLEALIPGLTDPVLGRYFRHTTATRKSDGSIVTEADQAMQQGLSAALRETFAEAEMLGEEMDPAAQQAVIDSGRSYWCLDPLDGTNNFHHGLPLFSVSLALIHQQKLELALVYDPIRRELFSARLGGGLRINGQAVIRPDQPEGLRDCLAFVDFKRLKPPVKEKLLRGMPFKSQRNIGSCALEWAWLAAGRSQLLLHGGEKFWDYAAGVLLVQEGGGVSSTDDGSPIFNRSLDNRACIAASTEGLQQQWFAYLFQDA